MITVRSANYNTSNAAQVQPVRQRGISGIVTRLLVPSEPTGHRAYHRYRSLQTYTNLNPGDLHYGPSARHY